MVKYLQIFNEYLVVKWCRLISGSVGTPRSISKKTEQLIQNAWNKAQKDLSHSQINTPLLIFQHLKNYVVYLQMSLGSQKQCAQVREETEFKEIFFPWIKSFHGFPWLQLFLLSIGAASACSEMVLRLPHPKKSIYILPFPKPIIPWEQEKASTSLWQFFRTCSCSNENTTWQVHPPLSLIQKRGFVFSALFSYLIPRPDYTSVSLWQNLGSALL